MLTTDEITMSLMSDCYRKRSDWLMEKIKSSLLVGRKNMRPRFSKYGKDADGEPLWVMSGTLKERRSKASYVRLKERMMAKNPDKGKRHK